MAAKKTFYLSQTDKKIAGVCGGLAEYFNIDSTIVRLAAVLLALVTAVVPAIFVYFVTAIIAPQGPAETSTRKSDK